MNFDSWLLSAVDHQDLASLSHFADGENEALQDLLGRGLEWLSRIVPYDLAVVFELEDHRLYARAAKGPLVDSRVLHHRFDLHSFPSMRLAIEERRARIYTEEDHARGEGDPFDGIKNFPAGHACMVVPLLSGSSVYGILSLDRSECIRYSENAAALLDVFARMLGLTIQLVRQGKKLAEIGAVKEEQLLAMHKKFGGNRPPRTMLNTSLNKNVCLAFEQAELVAHTRSTVLILGETGTGKEKLANYIHLKSPRAKQAFVTLNCAALPQTLLESELFGHVKGAFTGATYSRPGFFRAADKGTLFLDEIGEFPFELQGKLLRALQEGEVQPLGSEKIYKVDVRVIAATHVDLEKAMANGRFREDLYYRLFVFPLRLIPLRERLCDLPELCRNILRDLRERLSLARPKDMDETEEISEAALRLLASYPFPGNIRELSNLLERALIQSRGFQLDVIHFAALSSRPLLSRHRPSELPTVPSWVTLNARKAPFFSLAENEKRYIEEVLFQTGGKIYGKGGAAEILDLPPTTLQSRMKKLGVVRTR